MKKKKTCSGSSHCPLCKKHCSLDKPHCKKGEKYVRKLKENSLPQKASGSTKPKKSSAKNAL